MENLYEILGLHPSCSHNDIRQHIMQHHAAGTLSIEDLEHTKNHLLDAQNRELYNQHLKKTAPHLFKPTKLTLTPQKAQRPLSDSDIARLLTDGTKKQKTDKLSLISKIISYPIGILFGLGSVHFFLDDKLITAGLALFIALVSFPFMRQLFGFGKVRKRHPITRSLVILGAIVLMVSLNQSHRGLTYEDLLLGKAHIARNQVPIQKAKNIFVNGANLKCELLLKEQMINPESTVFNLYDTAYRESGNQSEIRINKEFMSQDVNGATMPFKGTCFITKDDTKNVAWLENTP